MKQKAGSESSRAKVARLASLAGLVMILTLPLCASEVTDAAVWTVNSGQGLIECAEDPAHNIPRMEAGGRGVWNWRLVPVSSALGWEATTWAYNTAYEASAEPGPGLNVHYGWYGSYEANYARLRVNAGTADWTSGDVTVSPGQLYFHPERAMWHVLSFTPFETGTYAVDGFLRHYYGEKLQWGLPDTLTVELRCGGRTLYTDSGRGKVFNFANASFACRSGEAIELWVRADADWGNYACASTVAFEISQLAKSDAATVWRVNDALKAVKASDTPTATEMAFADDTGISLGAAKDGIFDPFTAMSHADATKWWMAPVWNFPYPFITVGNTADDTFGLFPGSTKTDATCTHVKIGWTAPADGLYRTSGYLTHIGAHSGQWGSSPTLEGGVMLAENGQLRRYGTFHNATSAEAGTGMGVDASRLWLRKGEKVWFATGPQEKSKNTNYMADMTARLTVARDDLENLPRVVAFDFGAPDAVGYVGRGVEGFSDMTFWNRCAVAEGSTGVRFDSLRRMDKKLVGVKLELSPIDEGKTLATGTADDAVCALYGDGIASASSVDVVNWTVSGLVRGKTYTLTFYGRSSCVFTVGNEVRLSPKAGNVWMTTEGGEYCQTTVTATGKTLSGQFYSSSDTQALWTCLQVSGESFRESAGIDIVIR